MFDNPFGEPSFIVIFNVHHCLKSTSLEVWVYEIELCHSILVNLSDLDQMGLYYFVASMIKCYFLFLLLPETHRTDNNNSHVFVCFQWHLIYSVGCRPNDYEVRNICLYR